MEEALASCLCLEKYPKSRFDCFINVLEDDGSALPVAITTASLAFADAGIEMFDLPTACSACLLSNAKGNNVVVLDPTWEEQKNSIGLLTLVFSPSLASITHLVQTGMFTTTELGEVRQLHKSLEVLTICRQWNFAKMVASSFMKCSSIAWHRNFLVQSDELIHFYLLVSFYTTEKETVSTDCTE